MLFIINESFTSNFCDYVWFVALKPPMAQLSNIEFTRN